jgi:hypothetical protein
MCAIDVITLEWKIYGSRELVKNRAVIQACILLLLFYSVFRNGLPLTETPDAIFFVQYADLEGNAINVVSTCLYIDWDLAVGKLYIGRREQNLNGKYR